MRPRSPGSSLGGGLTVVEHLRRGNDLDVYDASCARRACRVVVKTVRPDRPRAAGPLRAEGRMLLGFSHPHLVRAYELREQPRPAVVLEALPGHTLAALIDQQPLTAEEAAELMRHLASALHYLHGNGLLHLDVKSSNVVVHQGVAKLIDLSVARPPGRAARPGIGTWCYCSPEQARGGELSAASDVWGLGATLHEALTGEVTFDSADHEFPQLHRRAPRVDGPLADLVAGCLEPDPADRPRLDELLAYGWPACPPGTPVLVE